ncbi:MAG: alpha/beta fold hydrolase [Candidatus Binatia bacterium]
MKTRPQEQREHLWGIRFGALWVLAFLLLLCQEAAATHEVAHCQPPSAAAAFPSDFPILQDQEWGYSLGGWGGIAKGHPVRHHPVIFVHGNTRDAGDWDEPGRSVKQRFLHAGYSMQELWALSYNGKATKGFPPPSQCRTANQTNVPDLTAFVKAVLAYTGAPKVDLIAHSLGVTLARAMLVEHPELSQGVEDFVAIAGPNHGTTVCRRSWLIWLIGWKDFIGCDELAPGSAWLRSLNGSNGESEACETIRCLTIYDGTGADVFYLPWLFVLPVGDQDSPALEGAENRRMPGLTHDELRIHEDAVSLYLHFVQAQNNFNIPHR